MAEKLSSTAKGGGSAVFTLSLIAVLGAALGAFPVMLVLGALHNSSGLDAVPALGFFQTMGALFITGVVGKQLS